MWMLLRPDLCIMKVASAAYCNPLLSNKGLSSPLKETSTLMLINQSAIKEFLFFEFTQVLDLCILVC